MTQVVEENGFTALRQWLEQRCAIQFPDHKRDLLVQRLARVQRTFDLPTLAELSRHVTQLESHEIQLAVMHAASTNHTYFFREKDVLGHFQTHLLPQLAARDEIRLWSAACSSGDEVYTLAILIAEACGIDALKRTTILGTDISAPVIERAETGAYPARHLQEVPAALRNKYMRPVGIEQYQVIPEIRAACTFRRMNLKTAPYPFRKPFQAVFCRNVLYYFGQQAQVDVVNAIAEVTEPNGYMYTSVTENVRDLSPRWQAIGGGISRRIGGAS